MIEAADTTPHSTPAAVGEEAPESEWKHPVYGPTDKYTPGIAPIKPEYILARPTSSIDTVPIKQVDDDAAERSTNPATSSSTTSNGEPPKKLKGAARKRARREEAAALAAAQRAEKKSKAHDGEAVKKGGQNKARQFTSLKDGKGQCHGFLSKGEDGCKFAKTGGCRFSHDLVGYLQSKDRDLFLPPTPYAELQEMTREQKQSWLEERYSLTLLPVPVAGKGSEAGREAQTFVRANSSAAESAASKVPTSTDPAHASLDWTTSCPIFDLKGFCTMGWKCRFLGAHVRLVGPSSLLDPENATGFARSGLELVTDQVKVDAWRARSRAFVLPDAGEKKEALDQEELNHGSSAGMKAMRVRKYPLPKTKAVLQYLEKEAKELAQVDPQGGTAGRGPIPAQVVDERVENLNERLAVANDLLEIIHEHIANTAMSKM